MLSIREIARDKKKADDYFTTISLTKLVFSLGMFAVIAGVINLLDYPGDVVRIVYVFGLVNILNSFATFFRSIFRAFEKMEYDAITRIIERFLVVGAALIVLFQGHGLMAIVLAMLLAQVLSFLVTLFLCVRKFARPRLSLDLPLAKRLVRMAAPFALTTVFGSVLFQTDTVILSVLKGDTVVGWYNAAGRPILGILFLPSVFMGSIFPVLSRYYVTAKDSLVIVYQKSLKFLATLAVPLGIGTTLVAGRLILFLYGEDFASSVIIMQILVWSVSLIFITTLFGHTLASMDRQVVDMRIVGAFALVNVALNFALIPGFSYIGAAIASLISQSLVFTVEFTYLQRRLHRVNLAGIVAKPLLAALVMGALAYTLDRFLATNVINLFVIILAAIIVYGLLLWLFKAFDHEEIEALKEIVRRRSSGDNQIEVE